MAHRDRGQHHRRRLGDVAEPVGQEGVEAVEAAEEELAARALVPGPEVELAGLQAVADPVVHELARARVEAAQPVVRAEPEPSLPVVADAVDDVARQAAARGEGLEGLPVRVHVAQPAVRGHPEAPRGVDEQGMDGVGGQAVRVVRLMFEPLESPRARIEEVEHALDDRVQLEIKIDHLRRSAR